MLFHDLEDEDEKSCQTDVIRANRDGGLVVDYLAAMSSFTAMLRGTNESYSPESQIDRWLSDDGDALTYHLSCCHGPVRPLPPGPGWTLGASRTDQSDGSDSLPSLDSTACSKQSTLLNFAGTSEKSTTAAISVNATVESLDHLPSLDNMTHTRSTAEEVNTNSRGSNAIFIPAHEDSVTLAARTVLSNYAMLITQARETVDFLDRSENSQTLDQSENFRMSVVDAPFRHLAVAGCRERSIQSGKGHHQNTPNLTELAPTMFLASVPEESDFTTPILVDPKSLKRRGDNRSSGSSNGSRRVRTKRKRSTKLRNSRFRCIFYFCADVESRCDGKFATMRCLIRHLKSDRHRIWYCSKCSTCYRSEEALDEHACQLKCIDPFCVDNHLEQTWTSDCNDHTHLNSYVKWYRLFDLLKPDSSVPGWDEVEIFDSGDPCTNSTSYTRERQQQPVRVPDELARRDTAHPGMLDERIREVTQGERLPTASGTAQQLFSTWATSPAAVVWNAHVQFSELAEEMRELSNNMQSQNVRDRFQDIIDRALGSSSVLRNQMETMPFSLMAETLRDSEVDPRENISDLENLPFGAEERDFLADFLSDEILQSAEPGESRQDSGYATGSAADLK